MGGDAHWLPVPRSGAHASGRGSRSPYRRSRHQPQHHDAACGGAQRAAARGIQVHYCEVPGGVTTHVTISCTFAVPVISNTWRPSASEGVKVSPSGNRSL